MAISIATVGPGLKEGILWHFFDYSRCKVVLSDSWPLRLAVTRLPEAECRSRGKISYPKERGPDRNR